jgi:hypothetical protein
MDHGLTDIENIDVVICQQPGKVGADAGAIRPGNGNEDDFTHACIVCRE